MFAAPLIAPSMPSARPIMMIVPPTTRNPRNQFNTARRHDACDNIRKLDRLKQRNRAQRLAAGWSLDEDHDVEVPPGSARAG